MDMPGSWIPGEFVKKIAKILIIQSKLSVVKFVKMQAPHPISRPQNCSKNTLTPLLVCTLQMPIDNSGELIL